MAIARMTGFALVVLAAGAVTPVLAETGDKEKQAIKKIVREYILEHPEIIAEAIDKLREREKTAREESQRQAMATLAPQIYDNPKTPEMGNPKGDVTIVEFFDYQCGYCKRVFPAFMNVMKSDKNIRVLWKELPILGPVSRFAARAAMAADKQGKYFPYHVALMELRGQLTEDKVMQTAQEVGLDMKKLVKDMASPEIDRYLDETLHLAQSLGINGTPAFLFGDQLVPGAIEEDQMHELIEQHRKNKS
jgi:protein-disulfide isomerase